MPRKAARDGLPGGPGWAWAAVLRREADQVRGARRGLGAWAAAGRLGAWAAAGPGGGRGATHSPYTVAHGGNCTNRATTRRKTAPNAAKPPTGPGCRHHTDQRARQESNSQATMPGSGYNDRGHDS